MYKVIGLFYDGNEYYTEVLRVVDNKEQASDLAFEFSCQGINCYVEER